MIGNGNNLKNVFDPVLLSKLKTLELRAKYIVEGFMVGMHKSPYHGFSVEFSDHRSYMQGDPIKDIDWKVFARRDKYFIKRYTEETNLISYILLDISASMNYKHSGLMSKLDYAKLLAASLIHIMQKQQDAVGLTLYSEKIKEYFPPRANRVYARNLQKIISNIEPSKLTNTAECLNSIAGRIKKRGMVIIISDFFDDIEKMLQALKNFNYKKNEVLLFQILDPIELNFGFGKSSVFVDMETDEELVTQPLQIKTAYKEAINGFLSRLKRETVNNGMEYNLLTTEMPFDHALLSYFKKRKKLF